jgi:RNA polymerase sigma-70 factor, ECF subfamily
VSVQPSEPASPATDPVDDDLALIDRVRAGDEAAYDLLVQRHAARLLRMIAALVRRHEDAEDLMQETLAAAYFKLDTFAGRSSFFTWLYRIAVNRVISSRRRRRLESTHQGRPLEDAPAAISQEASAESRLSGAEQIDRVYEALAQLDEDRRIVVVLRDLEGLDYGQIADILDLPKGTVRSRLHRARGDLRTLLIGDDDAPGNHSPGRLP